MQPAWHSMECAPVLVLRAQSPDTPEGPAAPVLVSFTRFMAVYWNLKKIAFWHLSSQIPKAMSNSQKLDSLF